MERKLVQIATIPGFADESVGNLDGFSFFGNSGYELCAYRTWAGVFEGISGKQVEIYWMNT